MNYWKTRLSLAVVILATISFLTLLFPPDALRLKKSLQAERKGISCVSDSCRTIGQMFSLDEKNWDRAKSLDLSFQFAAGPVSGYQNVFQTDDGNAGLRLEISPSSAAALIVGLSAGPEFDVIKLPGDIAPGQWHDLRLSLSRSNRIKVWFDGKQIADRSNDAYGFNAGNFILGNGFDGKREFSGEIKNLNATCKTYRTANLTDSRRITAAILALALLALIWVSPAGQAVWPYVAMISLASFYLFVYPLFQGAKETVSLGSKTVRMNSYNSRSPNSSPITGSIPVKNATASGFQMDASFKPDNPIAGLPNLFQTAALGDGCRVELVPPSRLVFIGHTSGPEYRVVDIANNVKLGDWNALSMRMTGKKLYAKFNGRKILDGTKADDINCAAGEMALGIGYDGARKFSGEIKDARLVVSARGPISNEEKARQEALGFLSWILLLGALAGLFLRVKAAAGEWLKFFQKNMLTRAVVALLAVQVALFLLYLLAIVFRPEAVRIQSDEGFYVWQTFRFFKEFSLHRLIEFGRPVFSWPVICLFKLAGVMPTLPVTILLNTLYGHLMLVAGLGLFFSACGGGSVALAVALSAWLSMPIVLGLSTMLLADMVFAGYAVLLLGAIVKLYSMERGPGAYAFAVLTGIILALGFQTKAVFTMLGGAALGAYLSVLCAALLMTALEHGIKSLELKRKAVEHLPRALLMVAVFAAASYAFTFPKTYLELIHENFYNGQVIAGYYPWYMRGASLLWFPNILFQESTLFQSLVMSAAAAAALAAALWRILEVPGMRGKIVSMFRLLSRPATIAALALAVMLFYMSVFDGVKDARPFIFTFPIFFMLCAFALGKLLPKPLFAALAILLVGVNVINVYSWAPSRPSPFTDQNVSLRPWKLFKHNPPSFNEVTFAQLGIFETLEAIETDSQAKFPGKPLSMLLPHCSSYYNPTIFGTAQTLSSENYGILPGLRLRMQERPFAIGHGTYNWGDLYNDGGIPKGLFGMQYVGVVKDFKETCFGAGEIYNTTIQAEISAETPSFMDGLTLIKSLTPSFGKEIRVYRRDRLPAPENYLRIVRALASNDPGNLWNVPWLCSVLALSSKEEWALKQLSDMRNSGIAYTTKLRFATTRQQEEMVRDLLKDPGQCVSNPRYAYPEMAKLWWGGFN